MMNPTPQREYGSTFSGMCDYLSSCPSAALALALQDEIKSLKMQGKIDITAPLSVEGLEHLRQSLYARNHNSESGKGDILMMLADAMGGGSPRASNNPIEDRLRFVENLQEQISSGERVNFPRAFTAAIR